MESDPQDDELATAPRVLRGAAIFFLLLGTALAFMPVLGLAAGEFDLLLVSLGWFTEIVTAIYMAATGTTGAVEVRSAAGDSRRSAV